MAARFVRLLLGLIFVVFGLNGFFLFITPPRHSPDGGAFIDLLVSSGYMYVEKALLLIGVIPFLLWSFLMWIYRRRFRVLFTQRAEP